MRLPASLLLASLVSIINADVRVTQPTPGQVIPAGSISIQWADSGTAPALTTFTSYQIALMAGGNTAGSFQQVAMLVPNGAYTAGNVAQGVVPAGAGGDDTNAYFLKFTSVSATGGQVINYSSRFTMSGMSGKFPDAIQAGVTAAAGSTAGPATENSVANDPAAGDPGADGVIPYSLQTGITRYAPMQPLPPTKITAKTWTPLFPTSAFTVATTYMPNPSIVTTVTAKQTFSVESVENTVAAASQPGGNNAQARFLERWKD